MVWGGSEVLQLSTVLLSWSISLPRFAFTYTVFDTLLNLKWECNSPSKSLLSAKSLSLQLSKMFRFDENH